MGKKQSTRELDEEYSFSVYGCGNAYCNHCFAAAFTLPGGYNHDTGIPFFQQKPTVIIFVIANAFSLVFSSTSVLVFLSILTSRYAERDFLEMLPKKLMLGLATLFFRS
uniref:PGG domain-containing protein n=1 Tax=Lactuca sativa TaxID=4236 RepID=A0A9R1X8Y1_LACSA|nr:hypothetical protein LSAT_V11C600341270 [Lactuca sativa]